MGKNVIILIDEYDVPLDKAFENNYYNEMIILLRNMLEQSLKQMIIYTWPYQQAA